MTDPTTQSDADAPNLDEEMAAAVEGIDTSDVAASVSTAIDDATEDADAPTDADGMSSTGTDDAPDDDDSTDDETISVLEFVLGDERYCLDITFIEQIVERGTVTRVPNAPAFVEGVIDLRGDITTVIDPMETLAADSDGVGELIVVFDSARMDDEWSVGWAVDGVRRVSTVSLSAVKESPVDEPWINGVVKREDDGEFVIWTEPGELMRADGDDAA
jgi:purine-binding chemotaxis protein CheW